MTMTGDATPDVRLFEAHRGLLFSIAYRMLGSATEAEDVVQDAWLRYAGAPPQVLRSPRAWLGTIVTRLCLDRLKAARTTREQYVGPWLPEPMLDADREPSLARAVERRESVTLAFLVLLESLTPQERAVFLLREVFDFEYRDIAESLDLGPANCRQIFHRAKARLTEHRPPAGAARPERPASAGEPFPSGPSSRASSSAAGDTGRGARDETNETRHEPRHARGLRPPRARHQQLVHAFIEAVSRGDLEELRALLAEDVMLRSDGGGKVQAALHPLHGRDVVARFLIGARRKQLADAEARGATDPWTLSVVHVNGGPALLVVRTDGTLDSVVTFETTRDDIVLIDYVRNPDKLRYVKRQIERLAATDARDDRPPQPVD